MTWTRLLFRERRIFTVVLNFLRRDTFLFIIGATLFCVNVIYIIYYSNSSDFVVEFAFLPSLSLLAAAALSNHRDTNDQQLN